MYDEGWYGDAGDEIGKEIMSSLQSVFQERFSPCWDSTG